MKPIDGKSSTHIDFDVENDEYLKFRVGDPVTISKYQKLFLQNSKLQR